MELKKLRKEKGFRQEDLAAISGVKIKAIRDYEQGKRDLSKANGRTLYALAKALGCSMEKLVESAIPIEEHLK